MGVGAGGGGGLDRGEGVAGRRKRGKENEGEEEKGKEKEKPKEKKAEDGGLLKATATVDASKRWAGLPSANYALETSFMTSPTPTPTPTTSSPAMAEEEKEKETRLEDSSIIRRLERQAAVDSLKDGHDDDSSLDRAGKSRAGKPATKRSDSKGEAPVKARRRRRESKQYREKTPPLSPLESSQKSSMESNHSEQDEAMENASVNLTVPSANAEEKSATPEDAGPTAAPMAKPWRKTGVASGPSIGIPQFFSRTTIDVTPASPQYQDPPEIMEALGMGHFFNQSTQTPERFYREMCPSPHEFSLAVAQQLDKSTQTPEQFYPPIPTQDVAIDAGQFPEASNSVHSLDSSITEVEEPVSKPASVVKEDEEEPVFQEVPATVSIMPMPKKEKAGIFLTQVFENEESEKAEDTGFKPWQSSVELPEAPVFVLPPVPITITAPAPPPPAASPQAPSPVTFTLEQPAATPTPPPPQASPQPPQASPQPPQASPQPPTVVVQQPQSSAATTENAFEAWIETQNAYEEIPGATAAVQPTPTPPAPAAAVSLPPQPTTASAVVSSVSPGAMSQPETGQEQKRARAKQRRERRRRPAPVSESSTDSVATPPSTPTRKAAVMAATTEAARSGDERLRTSEQGKKKAPPPSASACESEGQSMGDNPQAGQNRGDKQEFPSGLENGVEGEGGRRRSSKGENKKQEFTQSSQASEAEEFVLAAESLENSSR